MGMQIVSMQSNPEGGHLTMACRFQVDVASFCSVNHFCFKDSKEAEKRHVCSLWRAAVVREALPGCASRGLLHPAPPLTSPGPVCLCTESSASRDGAGQLSTAGACGSQLP
jgi:hypothetical protein